MKRLISKLCILFIPISVIIIATNYYVDPANIFSDEAYVNEIATILASGNNVDNISNYNERLLQKHFLQKQSDKAPEVVVMGSSRIMEISKDIFPNKKLFNIGVSHANINDLVALTGLLDELHIKPKTVVINVDPYLICNDDIVADEWTSLKKYHNAFLINHCKDIIDSNKIKTGDNELKKYYTLITFDYFTKSIEFLLKGNTKIVENIGQNVPKKYGRYIDGSIAYSYTYQHPDTLNVAKVAKGTAKTKIPEIDNVKVAYLICLLNYFKKNGTTVTLTMLPFHPNFYDEVNRIQSNLFINYESLFNEFAKDQQVKIIGSFNSKKLGINNIYFYDPYHCSGAAIKKIFQIYNNQP